MDKQKGMPFSNDNYKDVKPKVPRTSARLSGYIANSFNGGHNRTIAWKQVFAGERHKEYKLKMHIKMLTPLTPTYQALKMTIRSYFVPNSRVWDNAEAFQAQNPTKSKPSCYPHLGVIPIPMVGSSNEATTGRQTGYVPLTQTEQWRDMFISSYVPRLFNNTVWQVESPALSYFPQINALPLRGRVAIYNDFERNKEYQEEITEYKGDYVSFAEASNYMPYSFTSTAATLNTNYWYPAAPTVGNATKEQSSKNLDYYQMRAKKDDNYYTDYRTKIGGFDSNYADTIDYLELQNSVSNTTYLGYSVGAMANFTWAKWENLIAEERSQAENANLNDWEIIAKIRGSKKLTEGKVQLIGQKTFNLNNKAVTQTSNNSSDTVDPMYRSMGTQGAYSYTEVEVPCYSGFEFNEDGFVHIIATVSADTVYESGIDATLLNIGWDEQYRPDMANEKTGLLRSLELTTNFNYSSTNTTPFKSYTSAETGTGSSAGGASTPYNNLTTITSGELFRNNAKIIGYKRKYNEYFKLPNVIGGDMTTEPWKNAQGGLTTTGTQENTPTVVSTFYNEALLTDGETRTNSTFQYFESSPSSISISYKTPVSSGPTATSFNPMELRSVSESSEESGVATLSDDDDDGYFEYDPTTGVPSGTLGGLTSPPNSWEGKQIWRDYTDLEINKNLAYQYPLVVSNGSDSNQIYVSGQNQIFFVGVAQCDAILPINSEIKNNKTEWGEH